MKWAVDRDPSERRFRRSRLSESLQPDIYIMINNSNKKSNFIAGGHHNMNNMY